MEELKKIVIKLKEIRKEQFTNLSDECLFENAVKIFISREIGKQKEQSKSDLASQKQKDFLKNLGFEGDVDKITKIEAQALIKELLEKSNNDY